MIPASPLRIRVSVERLEPVPGGSPFDVRARLVVSSVALPAMPPGTVVRRVSLVTRAGVLVDIPLTEPEPPEPVGPWRRRLRGARRRLRHLAAAFRP